MEEHVTKAHGNHERLEKIYRESNEFYGLNPHLKLQTITHQNFKGSKENLQDYRYLFFTLSYTQTQLFY